MHQLRLIGLFVCCLYYVFEVKQASWSGGQLPSLRKTKCSGGTGENVSALRVSGMEDWKGNLLFRIGAGAGTGRGGLLRGWADTFGRSAKRSAYAGVLEKEHMVGMGARCRCGRGSVPRLLGGQVTVRREDKNRSWTEWSAEQRKARPLFMLSGSAEVPFHEESKSIGQSTIWIER